jgi:23S rRNA (guanosine2251-2'-O)-methyltransferase
VKKKTDTPNTLETSSLSAIEHVLKYRPEWIRSLRLAERDSSRLAALETAAKENGIRPTRERLAEGESAIASFIPFPYAELKQLLPEWETQSRMLLLALDHVQDPQNLGAICRSAEALGVKGILLPKHRSALVTGTVFAASVGAVATLPICLVSNLNEGLRQLKDQGFWIVGSTLAEGATGFEAMPDFEKIVLVLGAEGEGMAEMTEKLCDWKLQIPLAGKVQSMNVSAAGAIFIFELIKRIQRSTPLKN